MMHKMMMMSNNALRCIALLAIVSLGSSSSLRSNTNNHNGVEQIYKARLLQSDVQQSTNSSESGSTLVVVGAVGAVISILILIGGVCYAKRQYSSDHNTNNGPGKRQYLNDTMEEKEMSNIISSMEKNAARKEKGGYFKQRSGSGSKGGSGTAIATNNHQNGRAAVAAAAVATDDSVGYESDVPPPPPDNSFINEEQTSDDESDNMHYNTTGAGNRSIADDHTTGDDDMSFAYSVAQSSIAPYNMQQQNTAIDPYIGGAAMKSFQNEKGGVFEWNEDGTKMVYTPAVGDEERKAQNGFVYDERKKKWVVSKQIVGAKGVSFKPTTSANDGNKSAMMMTDSPKELQRSHSDASTRSYGSGTTGNSGLTGMGSEFTFNAVGTDYSTVRTRSGTTFVSTGIAIPSSSNAVGGEEIEVEGSAIDRLMLMDNEDLSDGSSHEGNSNLGHVAGDLGDDEPGMIVPKKTIGRLKNNTIKEDTPFDEGGLKPRPKPVPNFDASPRHFVRKNRKPSFGRRV
mmetsp:Transcript_17484/g.28606  ORF Transcript_17484/g.28606 Transcript_17484/m.28606 type:complete len:512 (-) Transcript_17484:41-1576(-)